MHSRSRMLTETDAVIFNSSAHLEPMTALSPYLVFSVVLGLTVPDLSESGGPFLGADGIRFGKTPEVGATVRAASRVLSSRPSGSRAGWNVVEWETVGVDEEGEELLRFRRASLVRRENADD